MLAGSRNIDGLSDREVEQCLRAWQLLTDSEQFYVPLDVTRAHQHGSRTTFREADNVVRLGADVQPGDGADANSRMSLLACLAHELAHARRYRLGYNRPTEMPHCLLDEAETSVDASFFKILRPADREDLVATA